MFHIGSCVTATDEQYYENIDLRYFYHWPMVLCHFKYKTQRQSQGLFDS